MIKLCPGVTVKKLKTVFLMIKKNFENLSAHFIVVLK